jgi:hypothetical protein
MRDERTQRELHAILHAGELTPVAYDAVTFNDRPFVGGETGKGHTRRTV